MFSQNPFLFLFFQTVKAEADGERSGSYAYVNPDGRRVVVRYRAGRKGFRLLNPEEVLPKA